MTKYHLLVRLGSLVFLLGLLFLPSVVQATVNPVAPPPEKPKPNDGVLVIISRHDPVILEDFFAEFLKTDLAREAGVTDIQYKSYSTFTAWKNALSSEDTAIDIAWGGGPTLFNQLADLGLLEPITDADLLAQVNETVPDHLSGAEMKHYDDNGDLIWVANAISSFGFTVNHDVLERYNLDVPRTWDDLASTDFFVSEEIKTVAMGNAPDTTSNTRIYQVILQKYGWEKGWEIMTRMAGNGGIFGESIPTRAAVIEGNVAAAMTIDFYGIIAQRENQRCEYIIPLNGSIVNGDPIAFGKLGKNPEGAKAFFKYVTSAEGQAQWIIHDRLPVYAAAFNTTLGQTRPDVYSLYEKTMANQGIYFNETLSESEEFTMMDYFESTITDAFSDLKPAWSRLVRLYKAGTINETEFEEKVYNMTKPLISLQEAININERMMNDNSFRLSMKQTWREQAQDRYRAIYTTYESLDTGGGKEFTPFNTLWAFFAILGAASLLVHRSRVIKR